MHIKSNKIGRQELSIKKAKFMPINSIDKNQTYTAVTRVLCQKSVNNPDTLRGASRDARARMSHFVILRPLRRLHAHCESAICVSTPFRTPFVAPAQINTSGITIYEDAPNGRFMAENGSYRGIFIIQRCPDLPWSGSQINQ